MVCGLSPVESHVCSLGGLSHAECAVVDLSHSGLDWTGLCPSHGRHLGDAVVDNFFVGLVVSPSNVPFPCRRPCFLRSVMPPCPRHGIQTLRPVFSGGRQTSPGSGRPRYFYRFLLVRCPRASEPPAHEARDIPLRISGRLARSRLGFPDAISPGCVCA